MYALSEHLVSVFLVSELSVVYVLSSQVVSIFYNSFFLLMHGLSSNYALSPSVFLSSHARVSTYHVLSQIINKYCITWA